MGEVYKANDTRLDRSVAIKVLPEHLGESPERKQRFEREAKAISQLNHPHICTLYDVGEHDGTGFLVMEYIEGETLTDRLKKGALPLDEASNTESRSRMVWTKRIAQASSQRCEARQCDADEIRGEASYVLFGPSPMFSSGGESKRIVQIPAGCRH